MSERHRDLNRCECGTLKYRHSALCNKCRGHLHQKNAPDPTPDQIKAMCAEIQNEWSHEERMKRHWSSRGERHLYKTFRNHMR